MAAELTEQQQQSLDARGDFPFRITDPRTGVTYVLIPETDYESVHEIMEDDRRQQKIRAIGRRNAIGRLDEQP